MTKEELAVTLTGRDYRDELTVDEQMVDEQMAARAAGLVVVFGDSDDLMEFRGAIDDEIGCCGGGIAYLTAAGLLINECDSENCPHFKRLKKDAATIEAVWNADGYSWIYRTDIPHATFDILEDGEKYCRGIIFALADAK